MYLCPLCQQPLSISERQYRCSNQHSFDLAREGYVNLLPVQQKKSKQPGDNEQMMQARRLFLQAGWYNPLVEQITEQLTHRTNGYLLDLGCGEGYYSGQLHQKLADVTQYGIDISKVAIRSAAKAYPDIQFAVASSYQLPFAANSFDQLLRIYAPSLDSEIARVLKAGGHILSVSPAPEHLLQIKAAIYPQVRYHSEEIININGLVHRQRQRLSFDLSLPSADLINLITMVPLGWKFSTEKLAAFVDTAPTIRCDFYLDTYQKPL